MARNSVTGRFRDIEILFSVDGDATIMSVRNLVNQERQVRVMYQKLLMSGLANWMQFQLTDTPVSRRLPAEILDAYRLTFFVDDADPVSARIKKILAELEALKPEQPEENASDPLPEVAPPTSESPTEIQDDVHKPTLGSPADIATAVPPAPLEPQNRENESSVSTQQLKEPKPEIPEPIRASIDENEQAPESQPATAPMALKLSPTQDAVSVSSIMDPNLEFKIAVRALPPSARAAQQKAQASAQLDAAAPKTRSTSLKREGVFGQLARALRLPGGGRRGKVYYQQKGEAIQNVFQDQLAKLERDYNEGYGLNLLDWDMDTLTEAEIAILLMNLMVSEVIAWRKETGRATPETEQLVQTLDEVDERLRRTLKQTRGVSAPSPTLFPDLAAESARDLEKIQNECDAYLQRFTGKLIQQEKRHAEKIDVLIFKRFLIQFIRDFLFVEVAESTRGSELPERLHWFLDLVDSEVIPIEVGETKVSPKYHKVKGVRASELATGTIVEVVTAGLQSKDGKRVSQMAVVIETE